MVIHAGGQNICGATIGVLCLESYFPKPPGHIKNTLSLPFPVLNEMINGLKRLVSVVLFRPWAPFLPIKTTV